jgi:multidrug resistance efflux pump
MTVSNDANNSLLLTLIELIRRAQKAASADELAFLVTNDTYGLLPYRQSALWLADSGVKTLSGVVQIEANAPYVLWLNKLFELLATQSPSPQLVSKNDVSEIVASEWVEWIPAYALWLPLMTKEGTLFGALLFATDRAWTEQDQALLVEWVASWQHAWLAMFKPKSFTWSTIKQLVSDLRHLKQGLAWWRHTRFYWLLACFILFLMPVHLSVLAPGELVPSDPALIRAPLDGVVGQFYVKPNQMVKAGQPLFSFDEATLLSRKEVARHSLATVEAEYRQQQQQALADVKAKSMLAMTAGRIAEKQAELEFVEGQVSRLQVLAPIDGIALFDDPSEWIGKPVQTGERIIRVANPSEVEVEAWVEVGDAIPIAVNSKVSLYLNASPLSSVSAKVRYMAHDAVQRPDGSYAYRVRAKLDEKSNHRVGLKGTVRLNGEQVPLIYWIIRRPLAVIRQAIGW